eukprot:5333067-Pyramimonas_sp.AAC.1
MWKSVVGRGGRPRYPEHRAIMWLLAQFRACLSLRSSDQGAGAQASRIGALLCDPPASVKRHSAMFYGTLERVRGFVSSLGGRQMTADQLEAAHNLFGSISGAASQAEASFKT